MLRVTAGRKIKRTLLFLPAVVVFLTTALAGHLSYDAFISNRESSERTTIVQELSVVRARLEGQINGNAQLVRGLASLIAVDPGIKQDRFARIASELLLNKSQIRNIGAAPDLVIRLMYPLEGNEAALGLDYNSNETQRAAAMRAPGRQYHSRRSRRSSAGRQGVDRPCTGIRHRRGERNQTVLGLGLGGLGPRRAVRCRRCRLV